MTPQRALTGFLDRLAASKVGALYISSDKLGIWSAEVVAALKAARILVKAPPASGIVCPGCEKQCTKEVVIRPADESRPAQAFIICDEPEAMGRIEVALSALVRWRLTGELLACAVSHMLGFAEPPHQNGIGKWTLGSLKGRKRRADLGLTIDGQVAFTVAGHTASVAEIVTLEGNHLTANKAELLKLVDDPADDLETERPERRRDRLREHIDQEKARGTKPFLQKVAREEGISVTRLKQLTSGGRGSGGDNWPEFTVRLKKGTGSKRMKPK